MTCLAGKPARFLNAYGVSSALAFMATRSSAILRLVGGLQDHARLARAFLPLQEKNIV